MFLLLFFLVPGTVVSGSGAPQGCSRVRSLSSPNITLPYPCSTLTPAPRADPASTKFAYELVKFPLCSSILVFLTCNLEHVVQLCLTSPHTASNLPQLGRTLLNLSPTWPQFGPTWSQLGLNLAQAERQDGLMLGFE